MTVGELRKSIKELQGKREMTKEYKKTCWFENPVESFFLLISMPHSNEKEK